MATNSADLIVIENYKHPKYTPQPTKNPILRIIRKYIPSYEVLDMQLFSWDDADKLLKENEGKDEGEQWHLSSKDVGCPIGLVVLERKIRLW